ncbi:MAG: DUF1461 domain-containing protein [Candidatus Woesearchaeota archaeon]|jgi:uncharacterized membrane protein|nr:DUF1461 domain-containing protein [Candidatus Woesearchaeota archaeon]
MKLKNFLLFVSFFYLSLYVPLTYTIYSSSSYELNYDKQRIYNYTSEEIVMNSTKNLINYFYHKEDLNENWNDKEKVHFSEVRNIYDILFLLSIVSLIIFIIKFNRKKIGKYPIINSLIFILSFLIVPFFIFFWDKIFHPLLFSNELWILNPNDLSYYLFPYEFFINSFIFIILIAIVINLIFHIVFNAKRITI